MIPFPAERFARLAVPESAVASRSSLGFFDRCTVSPVAVSSAGRARSKTLTPRDTRVRASRLESFPRQEKTGSRRCVIPFPAERFAQFAVPESAFASRCSLGFFDRCTVFPFAVSSTGRARSKRSRRVERASRLESFPRQEKTGSRRCVSLFSGGGQEIRTLAPR